MSSYFGAKIQIYIINPHPESVGHTLYLRNPLTYDRENLHA